MRTDYFGRKGAGLEEGRFDASAVDATSSSSVQSFLSQVRRHLHRNPEVGFQEHDTSALIARVLSSAGLDVRSAAGTGLYVDIDGPRAGKRVAYRADLDALPAVDAKSVPYASERNGTAHLCGHDVHSAIAIGIALLLNGRRAELPGCVRVFFQPNEEGIPSGAPVMIRDGVLDGVDAIYAVHVDPTLAVGRFGLITGAATAAADRFEVHVSGATSGHSARPHQSVDTVWTATQIAQHLYQLPGRITDSRNPAVLVICRFDAGVAFNVIPRHVSFGGTLRCTSQADRQLLKDRLISASKQIGAIHGAQIDVTFDSGAPPVINHPEYVDSVARIAERMFGRDSVVRITTPSMGAEDFSYYLESVPGAMVRVGTSSSSTTSYPLHDSMFDIDEAAMEPAARLMAEVLMDRLSVLAAT